MKKVLILGANFNNKGAQSMLFITVSEIRKINDDCEIYFASTKEYDDHNYLFKELCYSERSREIALSERTYLTIIESAIKDTIKFVIGRRNEFLWEFMDLKRLLPNIDLIIDISGFSIGDQWSIRIQEKYLDGIRLARKYNIPMILMPQSFGPFEYDQDSKFLLKEIADLFKYPDVIFARETTGYNDLIQKFQLTNVQLSTDLVLQNSGIDTKYIFLKPPVIQTPHVENGSVAIIPNMQCFSHGEKQKILNCYTTIINILLSNNKEVYIFRHSGEDLTACEWIYETFQNNQHVWLLQNDFSCLEYDDIVKKFDFIICSRYHGIVHAYRNDVPAIILGWAEKYFELAELMGQSKYVYNITSEKIATNDIEIAVCTMLDNWPLESETIKNKVTEVQKASCFSVLKNYL